MAIAHARGCVGSAGTAAPTPADQFALPVGFAFEGSYSCGSASTSARIIVTAWPYAARVQFFPTTASCNGEITLANGVWTSATQTWALSPGAWVTNPCSYSMIGFSGRVEAVGGLQRFSGAIVPSTTCQTFSAIEVLPTPAPTAAPVGESQPPPTPFC